MSFFKLFDEFLLKRKLSKGRLSSIKVVYRSMKRYELYKRKSDKDFRIDLKSFDENTLLDLEVFFKSEEEVYKRYPDIYKKVAESRRPEQRGQNTVNDIFVKLRTFMIWCVENGFIKSNPFLKFPIEECVYGTPYYITIAERNQIYAKDFSDRHQLEVQRDIFVFHCLVGCRVGDLYRLKKSNIIKGAVEYVARKTKDGNPVTVRVPLNSIAVKILEKYEDEKKRQYITVYF